MMTDPESGNFVGVGESSTYNILKHLTFLRPRSLKEFPKNGIYKQIPIEWILHKHDFKMLSQAHQNGSVDIFLILNQKRIAIRVQGDGHGEFLKGLGKAKHDKVQKGLLQKYCDVVDVEKRECPNVFKERVTEVAKKEIISSFNTANVLIPLSQEMT